MRRPLEVLELPTRRHPQQMPPTFTFGRELALYSSARPSIVTPDQFEKRATRISERILAAVSSTAAAAKVPCRCLTVWNASIADEILRAVRTERCELIVMASHGRTGLQRILLGSITQKVLAASRVPVMVLPL